MGAASAGRNQGHEHGRLEIGDLTVDLGTHQVTRRDGTAIELPSLTFRLLVALAREAPNVVSHDALVERVWDGVIVSPETVTQRIKLLRQAIGDDARNPRYIGVVRGEGYRVLAPVAQVAQVAPPANPAGFDITQRPVAAAPPRRAGRLVAAMLITAAIAGAGWWLTGARDAERNAILLPDNAVAVLPFVNASERSGDFYISDGIADELRDQLARIAGLQVSARTSSIAFRSQPTDIRTIAEQLRVRWLIEGTLRRQNERIVVTVQVIDGNTGFGTQSRNFERGLDDLLALQQDIAAEVVMGLMVASGRDLIPSPPITESVSAFELMLLARQLEQQVREEPLVDVFTLDRAIELYRDATRADPSSALAHTRLAGALLYRGDVDGAAAPVQRALELDPNLSEVQHTVALYQWRRGEDAAGEAFARAVELNPNNVDALWEFAKWRWHQPIIDEPGIYFRRGLELDPLSLARYADIGNYYGMSGMKAEALEIAARVEELFSGPNAYVVLGRIHEVAGELDEAIAWATQARVEDPSMPEPIWQLGELYARIGDAATAASEEPEPGVGHLFFVRRYDELIATAEEQMFDYPDDLKLYYLLAFAHNVQGNAALAERLLLRAGLPHTAYTEARKADAVEGLVFLADASRALGKEDVAREYAAWIVDFMQRHFETGDERSWWPILYQACAFSMLGEHERALTRLEQLPGTPGLAWYPVLVDTPCFASYHVDERYRRVVGEIEERMRQYRERVPDTLARHGLTAYLPRDYD